MHADKLYLVYQAAAADELCTASESNGAVIVFVVESQVPTVIVVEIR